MTQEAKVDVARQFPLMAAELAASRRSGRVYVFSADSLRVTVELGIVDQRWQAIGFDVRAYVDGDPRDEPLTARELRAVPFGALVDAARAELKKENEELLAREGPVFKVDDQGIHRASFSAAGAQRGLERLKTPRPGRPRLSGTEIEKEADKYKEFAKDGRQPTKDLAEYIHLSRSAAAKHVQRARALGFLSKTSPGIPKS